MGLEKIFVKANDIEDSDIISSLIQDSILHVDSHSFHDDKKCLRFMLNRFCWENMEDLQSNECGFRVHSGLYIHKVLSIVINDNLKKNTEKYLNLLTMHITEKEINFLFSDEKHMCVHVGEIRVHMKDLHEKYPTISYPEHLW